MDIKNLSDTELQARITTLCKQYAERHRLALVERVKADKTGQERDAARNELRERQAEQLKENEDVE
jgi:hypothetical protein